MLSCVLGVLCGVLILIADQISKYYIVSNLVLGEQHRFINGIINIVFVENRGAAWGMLSGKRWILLCFTALAMIICIIWLIKTGSKAKLLFWALCLVIAGGVGNMTDRIFREGVVVDFLQFDFWENFPVFNIADCAIVVGGAMLILYFLIDTIKNYKIAKESNPKEKPKNNESN